MIDCPNGTVRDLLPDYLNDRLDAARRAEVEAHVHGCEACRAELALLRALRATAQRVPDVDVRAIAAAIPPYRAPARRGWTSGWRAAAAIAAIAIGGASFALLRDAGRAPSRAPAREVASVTPSSPSTPAPDVGPVAPERSPAVTGPSGAVRSPGPARLPAPAEETRELAMAGSTIGELSDGELSRLVEGLESLDALPSTEVEGAEPGSAGLEEPSR